MCVKLKQIIIPFLPLVKSSKNERAYKNVKQIVPQEKMVLWIHISDSFVTNKDIINQIETIAKKFFKMGFYVLNSKDAVPADDSDDDECFHVNGEKTEIKEVYRRIGLCYALVVFLEDDEHKFRSALEIGAALALNKKVFICNCTANNKTNWDEHGFLEQAGVEFVESPENLHDRVVYSVIGSIGLNETTTVTDNTIHYLKSK